MSQKLFPYPLGTVDPLDNKIENRKWVYRPGWWREIEAGRVKSGTKKVPKVRKK